MKYCRAISTFTSRAEVLRHWLDADAALARAQLMKCLQSPTAWFCQHQLFCKVTSPESEPGSFPSQSHQPSESAEILASVIQTVMQRLRVVPETAVRLKFVVEVLQPLLHIYEQNLDNASVVCDLSGPMMSSDCLLYTSPSPRD